MMAASITKLIIVAFIFLVVLLMSSTEPNARVILLFWAKEHLNQCDLAVAQVRRGRNAG
jgi:hypothetical protein